jgi:Fic family protein
MKRLLTNTFYDSWLSSLAVDLASEFEKLSIREWTAKDFTFATAVSVMSSARIEGETLEVDSYVKHKMLNIEYLPNLTEKPNDLFRAYEFAKDHVVSKDHFHAIHALATLHLLPESQRGQVRKGNMLIMDDQTQQVVYEAVAFQLVENEYAQFWTELDELVHSKLSVEEIFYYASLIHLVFVKIHPFNDGNGRTARLLEKWFLATKLGEKAWFIQSEFHYYNNLKKYYENLSRIGLFYEELDYKKSIPFLQMLPQSFDIKK